MLAMARDGAEPAELLRLAATTANQEDVETHLLSRLIPSTYDNGNGDWPADRAHRWLALLAHHLNQRGTADFAWWQLPHAVRHPLPVFGLAGGLAVGLAFSLTVGFEGGQWFGLAVGLLFGVAFGLRSTWTVGHDALPAPHIGRPRQSGRRFAYGLACGPAAGLACGLVLFWTNTHPAGPDGGLTLALTGGLSTGLTLGIASPRPLFTTRVTSPTSLISHNRRTVMSVMSATALMGGLTFGIVFGLAVSLSVGLLFGLLFGSVAGMADGLLFGITVALGYGLHTAWGGYVVAHAYLAARGRLPWKFMAFLSDARDRGVLRQVGGVYQFRHARLRDQLAAEYGGGQ
jgi:hypothetical protein